MSESKNKSASKTIIIIGLLLLLGAAALLIFRATSSTPDAKELGRLSAEEQKSDDAHSTKASKNGHNYGDGSEEGEDREALKLCTLVGRVEYTDGQGVAGAIITLQLEERGRRFPSLESQSATADEKGHFKMEGLDCQKSKVTATGDGGTSRTKEVVLSETAPDGEVRLVLIEGGYLLKGQIRDLQGGALPQSTVQAIFFPGGGAFSVRSDEEGRYSLRLAPGTYIVEARQEDYAPARRRLTLNRDREMDFNLDPAGTVRGRVVDSMSGEGVVGAVVTARLSRRRFSPPLQTQSQSDGSFELQGLGPGNYNLEASRGRLRGHYPRQLPVQIASYTQDILIEIKAGPVIYGRVLDDEESPITGAQISWRAFGAAPAETFSDSGGAFVLSGMGPGRGRIQATHPGHSTSQERLNLGSEDMEFNFTLKAGAQIKGTVSLKDGSPVADAVVLGMSQQSSFRRRMAMASAHDISDTQGEFLLEDVAPGDFTVRAQHPAYGFATADLEELRPGAEYTVKLVMNPGGKVSGKVLWTDGEAAQGAVVHATSRALGPMAAQEAETGEAGFYQLTGLQEGHYRLWVSRPGVTNMTRFPDQNAPQTEIEIQNIEEQSGVDFELERADHFIHGRVIDESGSPVADADVGAESTESSTRFGRPSSSGIQTRSDVEGRFELNELTAGTYTLWAELPGFPRAESEEVEADSQDVVITIPPGASLSGTVVDTQQNPVSAYELRVIPTDESEGWLRWRGSDQMQIDNSEGFFEVRGLRAGTYRLVATTPDAQVGEVAGVILNVSEEKSVQIQLTTGAQVKGQLFSHPSGAPVTNVEVFVVSEGGRSSDHTDEDGRFEAEGLAPGKGVVIVSVDSQIYRRDRFDITIQEDETTLKLYLVEESSISPERARPPIQIVPLSGVLTVTPLTPTSIPGLTPGDALQSIDGTPIAGFGRRGAEALLWGPAASSTRLELFSTSRGEAYTLTLQRVAEP